MSALLDMLVPACALSALAAVGVALLPNAPARLRLAVCIVGLAAWLVPWPLIHLPLPGAAAPGPLAGFWALQSGAPAGDLRTLAAQVLAALTLAGLVPFAADWLALRCAVRSWRAASRSGDSLRALLPPELRAVRAEIRIVRDSGVAAASGWLAPVVWVGDRHTGPTLELILVHELWHVRRRDPLTLALIGAVRRLYWWNPLVVHLAERAVLLVESSCDYRCARTLGKRRYIAGLAKFVLGDAGDAPRLIATARSASFNVARLRLLCAPVTLRARDIVLMAAFALVGAAAAAASVVEPRAAPAIASPGAALPQTPAARALNALIGAANAGDADALRDSLGAYTPQELALPFPTSGKVRVVDVLSSTRQRIEFVAESADGTRRIGELSVADPAGRTIASARARELP